MWILSDTVTFPIMQISLLVICFIAFANGSATTAPMPNSLPQPSNATDTTAATVMRSETSLKADATPVRGQPSMRALGATAGFAIVVITLINGSAFNNEKFGFKEFSVAFNTLDTLAICYLCFVCTWSRSKILAKFEAARTEK
jgi:hypothetical protein